MGWQEDRARERQEAKDLAESGIGRRFPEFPWWVWVAVAFAVVAFIGGVLSATGSRSAPQSKSNTPANSAPHIDKAAPTPKRARIDGLGAKRVQGAATTPDTRRCTFDHGTEVLIWEVVGDRSKVSHVCSTWIENRHLIRLE